MNRMKKYILNLKSREIKKDAKIILKEKYDEFDKYINLFYEDKNKYLQEIIKNREVFGNDPESTDIYTALKNFAVYNNTGVIYYKADVFDKKAEWNRTAEMFDILFQDILSQEIILDILRMCFFTDEEYSAERFFGFISGVLGKNGLRMYFLYDNSDLLLFFILKKDIKIKYIDFSKFLLNDGRDSKKGIYLAGE